MAENDNYVAALTEALSARADWLDRSELPKLKEELRSYQTGFASLYNLYLKKGLIHEDPYKQETKIGELEVPSAEPFPDSERLEQLTQRLANYDNQLDFLVNFYQFGSEFLTLDRIKRILGLVKYIDWVHLVPDSQNSMTKAVAEMTSQIKAGTDSLTMSVIGESIANLNRSFNPIMGYLKILTDYQREAYKLTLREFSSGMSRAEMSNLPQLRKKILQTKPGTPFYADLAEEVIREDFSEDGPVLREGVLKKLQTAENKPKAVKAAPPLKTILIEGIQILGGASATLSETLAKLGENQVLVENKKKNLAEKIRLLFRKLLNKGPDPVIYDIQFNDPIKGGVVRERVNFNAFRSDLERKIRTLAPVAARSGSAEKLEAMPDEQLTGFLERNVRELQSIHKTLTALDEFFKAEVDKVDREKIKGIKPELGTIKSAIVRANTKRHEYSAQKEEEEQLKRLGIKPES